MSAMTKSEIDPQFKFDLARRLGGDSIKRCFACGTCTASCPVSGVREDFDPRKIIHMILLGHKKQVLSSDMIWYCSLCNTCSFVCPQDVRFSEAMVVIRQMALENGYIPVSFQARWQQLERLGQQFRTEMLNSFLAERGQEQLLSPEELLRKAYAHCIGGK
ncbi:MAG: 4Fe-4S dicluster domain-containing protein [Thermodesulfobacteriota bacterium]